MGEVNAKVVTAIKEHMAWAAEESGLEMGLGPSRSGLIPIAPVPFPTLFRNFLKTRLKRSEDCPETRSHCRETCLD